MICSSECLYLNKVVFFEMLLDILYEKCNCLRVANKNLTYKYKMCLDAISLLHKWLRLNQY